MRVIFRRPRIDRPENSHDRQRAARTRNQHLFRRRHLERDGRGDGRRDEGCDVRARGGAPQGEKADANTPHAKPAGLRGPRVVEGGRVHRAGVVVSVGPTDIFVEFGPKELGIVPRDQFPGEDELPKVGQELKVVVNKFESSEGIYICSRPGSVQKAEWELLEPGQVVEARVTGHNKGGLELEIANHRAFMPAGQVGGRSAPAGR